MTMRIALTSPPSVDMAGEASKRPRSRAAARQRRSGSGQSSDGTGGGWPAAGAGRRSGEQLPRDRLLLDLDRALLKALGPRVAVDPLDRRLGEEADAAEHRQGMIGDALEHLGGEQLRLGRLSRARARIRLP